MKKILIIGISGTGKTRPEIPKGCIESFDVEFFKNILLKTERTEIENRIKGFEDKIIRLKSRKEADQYLKNYANPTS